MCNCRQCLKKTRLRCINENPIPLAEKARIWRLFTTGEDTEEVRQLLQKHCLLRREAKEETPDALLPLPGTQPVRREKTFERKSITRPRIIGRAEMMPPRPAESALPLESAVEEPREPQEAPPCSLTVVSTGHRIALPVKGELVMGRTDLEVGFTPDVDLTFDDVKNTRSISRRHARISVRRGQHFIEDLGSTNGTRVNGRLLEPGEKVSLLPGDRIVLGLEELTYDLSPRWLSMPAGHPYRAFFVATFSGNRYYLPPEAEITLGRSDPDIDTTVDVDLSQEGEVAGGVSPLHARVFQESGLHLVEAPGSTYGTKLNGAKLEAGELVPLHPGDHLCLSGCVLYYDLEVQAKSA
jgi:pSer/pThr/pTyr-binding forkhead associated (FHA) protein